MAQQSLHLRANSSLARPACGACPLCARRSTAGSTTQTWATFPSCRRCRACRCRCVPACPAARSLCFWPLLPSAFRGRGAAIAAGRPPHLAPRAPPWLMAGVEVPLSRVLWLNFTNWPVPAGPLGHRQNRVDDPGCGGRRVSLVSMRRGSTGAVAGWPGSASLMRAARARTCLPYVHGPAAACCPIAADWKCCARSISSACALESCL